METTYSSNADRLEYLYLNLVGQVVQVRLVDGSSLEGIFVSRTDVDADTEAGILLCCTRCLPSLKHKPLDPSCLELLEDTIIPYRDVVMMEVQNAKIRTEAPGRTDTVRSDYSMNKIDWADEGANELLDSEQHQTGAWDQFEANEKNFGVKTTYKEELYTTRLDHSKITEEQRAHADRVAREIEVSATRGIAHRMEREEFLKDDGGMDEGTLYSDVQRPQEKKKTYVPPPVAAARKAAGEMQTAAPAAAPVTTTAAATVAAAAMAVDDNTMRHRRMEEEKIPMPHDNHPRSPGFNPAAVPYTPMKTGAASAPVLDFMTLLADTIMSNEQCYESLPNWPGTCMYYDQDDSSYSQQNYENAVVPPSMGAAPQMYVTPQQGLPSHHRAYQGGGGRMNPNQQVPMHHMHAQSFHQQHQHQQHQHQQQQPQQQPFHVYGNYMPQHQHNAPMQEYPPNKGAPPGPMRNSMRQPKSSSASRVEPQQPVTANTSVAPPPVPTVDSAPTPTPEVKHAPKLQRGRGGTAPQRGGDGDGAGDAAGGNPGAANPPAGPKKRSGK
ncbi:hypothetical protein TCSYLVIO_000508 [Trypanosoma cruzi]|uniref:LsmAD domain-containing protein n=2 Tax=Trypanosoma cruzi TaxID=5693 RepID=V5DKQ2_TRYCR|nr:hypothetical protein TCSYLVIO_000508 [Trypanosoma cruzi]ESS67991.1 hypothetical protein TCDM_03319 [Trypanosoma cruzi Dm28c]KAF8287546.1 putative PAB1-binding protein [Trypanosoma cruzi]PWU95610.1 putative PAB1-binding protein [Trypanosoma cruzi]RNF22502.1 putative ataxin-2 isoform X1 [Trypanosoma cruzi]